MTALASVLAGLVTYELERSLVKAARLGLTVSGPLLPDMSEAAVTASARDDQAWLTRLAAHQQWPHLHVDHVYVAVAGSQRPVRQPEHEVRWFTLADICTAPDVLEDSRILATQQPVVFTANLADRSLWALPGRS